LKKLFLAVMLLGAMAAHADTIVVGHLYNAGHTNTAGTFDGDFYMENLTNVTIRVISDNVNGSDDLALGINVSAGAFTHFLGYGNFDPETLVRFNGVLLSNSFTVDGIQYFAADTSWHVPNVAINTNEPIYNITVEANAVDAAPVPEPATMALLGTGLIGFGIRRFRKA
jgi:hypothetical protein